MLCIDIWISKLRRVRDNSHTRLCWACKPCSESVCSLEWRSYESQNPGGLPALDKLLVSVPPSTPGRAEARCNFVQTCLHYSQCLCTPLRCSRNILLLEGRSWTESVSTLHFAFACADSQLRCQCWMHLLEQSEHRINDQDESLPFPSESLPSLA